MVHGYKTTPSLKPHCQRPYHFFISLINHLNINNNLFVDQISLIFIIYIIFLFIKKGFIKTLYLIIFPDKVTEL